MKKNKTNILLTVLVCSVLIITSVSVGIAADGFNRSENEEEDGFVYESDGVKYRAHYMTEEEVERMKEKRGVYDPDKDYNEKINGHGTGLAPPTEEQYRSWIGNKIVIEEPLESDRKIQASNDLSAEPYFPEIGNQGSQGSCSSWSAAYYNNGYIQAKEHNWTDAGDGNHDHLLSPAWIYNKLSGGSDSGSSIGEPFSYMESVGTATLAAHPYDDSDIYGFGGEMAWRTAPRYRISGYTSISYSESNLKSYIDQGKPISFGINGDAYPDGLGENDDTLTADEYSGTMNHANTVVGYDDNHQSPDGSYSGTAFKVANSWGKSWGEEWDGDGFFWATPGALSEMGSFTVMSDLQDHEPSLLATFSAEGSTSITPTISLNSGGSFSADWSDNGYNYEDPETGCGDFMAIDATDLYSDWANNGYTGTFELDMSGSWNSATINSFRIEYYGGGYYNPSAPSQVSANSDDCPASDGVASLTFSREDLTTALYNPKTNLTFGGEALKGGEDMDIGYRITAGNISGVQLDMAYHDGSTWTNITTINPSSSPGRYRWTIPTIDSNAVKLKCNASDGSGNTDEYITDEFEIDSTAPKVLSTTPIDEAVNVPQNRSSVEIEYSEKMDTSTFTSSNIDVQPSVPYQFVKESNRTILSLADGCPYEGTIPASFYGGYMTAQTFKATQSGTIERVKVFIQKVGTPSSDATVEIRELDSEGNPAGPTLGSASIPASEVTADQFEWKTVNFSSQVTLTNGTSYGVVCLTSGGDGDNGYDFGTGDDTYAEGKTYQYDPDNSQWNSLPYDSSCKVIYENELQNDTVYEVSLNNKITDDVGNPLNTQKFWFSTGEGDPPSCEISLTSGGASNGWNFVSSNIIPEDTNITAVLEDSPDNITGNYDRLMYYDSRNDEWNSFIKGRESHLNDLKTWDVNMGIWVHMTTDDTLKIVGSEPTNTTITLQPGWNMVGYPSSSNTTADTTLPDQVTRIGVQDASTDYNVDYRTDLSNVTLFSKSGYWVYNSDENPVDWTVQY
ncbi:MAG: Ig-like domain-containing protein [Candidatus Thermoplasmatota archaeon]|nr:Ig-like domain-containing protein [Candidatus Thermoplasmatota archaeon]